jgi:nucleoside-diphosphate-sugar epimerase
MGHTPVRELLPGSLSIGQTHECTLKILVTGATGFTGGHLARRLLSDGHSVRALVRSETQAQQLATQGIEACVGQLTRLEDVLRAARGCDQIHHLAAVYRTAGHPDSYYREVNVTGTLNVLDAARQVQCERVVHCSTGGVHGHIARPPADESYPFGPGDVYQRTKLEAELAVTAAGQRGQPVTIFRPGAIYGEGDLRFLKLFRAIRNGAFVMIGSGETRLHLVHIDDLVAGILLCSSRPEARGELFLLAGPEAPTLNEIVRHIATALDVGVPRLHVPVWPVYAAGWLCEKICVPLRIDPPLHRRRVGFFTHHREFDCSKAARLLGYSPAVSAAAGIARTAAWYGAAGYLEPGRRTA